MRTGATTHGGSLGERRGAAPFSWRSMSPHRVGFSLYVMTRLRLLGLFLGMLASCGESEPKLPVQVQEPPEDTATEEAKVRPAPSDAYVTILQTRGGGRIRYQLGDRETADIEELGRWLRRLKETFDEGGLTPVGRVYASRSTSRQDIKAVLQEFADAGFDKVDFKGPR